MLEIPDDLHAPHEFIARTISAIGDNPFTTADGRLQTRPQPGHFDLKVSPAELNFTLRVLQAIINGCLERGLMLAPVERAGDHRAGVGIGQPNNFAAIWVEERRTPIAVSDVALEQWRTANPRWAIREEDYVRRGYLLTGDGQLRIRLSRRHDWPGPSGPGWRRSFSDQTGRPLAENLEAVVSELEARASAGP